MLTRARDAGAVPVVVLSGPPGAGKTMLALSVAHSLRSRFPDGQLYVQLDGGSAQHRAAGEVLRDVLRGLGAAPASIPQSPGQRVALYRSWLTGRRVLVLADDAYSARQVAPLLPPASGCALIVTSRSRLSGLTGAGLVLVDSLDCGDAVELLSRIVGPERVAAEPAAADRLVTACGLLPLAVRIASAMLAARPGWSLARMATLVADQRSLRAGLGFLGGIDAADAARVLVASRC